jgi:hypothetical protein
MERKIPERVSPACHQDHAILTLHYPILETMLAERCSEDGDNANSADHTDETTVDEDGDIVDGPTVLSQVKLSQTTHEFISRCLRGSVLR